MRGEKCAFMTARGTCVVFDGKKDPRTQCQFCPFRKEKRSFDVKRHIVGTFKHLTMKKDISKQAKYHAIRGLFDSMMRDWGHEDWMRMFGTDDWDVFLRQYVRKY